MLLLLACWVEEPEPGDSPVEADADTDADADADSDADGDSDADTDVACTGCYVDIAPGGEHGCALTDELEVVCWGHEAYWTGRNEDLVYQDLEGGARSMCGRRQGEQRWDCWGLQPPSGLAGDWEQVAFGRGNPSFCGIDADDGLHCSYDAGSLQVAADADILNMACALTLEGEVVCFGVNDTVTWEGGAGWERVAAGGLAACAWNEGGAIACEDVFQHVADWSPPSTGYVEVSMSFQAACGMKADGSVQCWGPESDALITDYPSDTGFTGLAVASNHACVLTPAGEGLCWGSDINGKLDVPAP